MNTKKPLILISNDDGYHAKGINSLIDMLRDIADIIVCAPESARSGFATAFSATVPLRLKLRRDEVGMQMWSCNGTPVDCVKIALQELFADRLPDMILGGINHGDNSSVNLHYSGTMGVVIEGCLKGVPSIGFSLCNHEPNADFEPAGPYIREIARLVLEKGLPPLTCLNVNFPDAKELKGVKICEQTKGQWSNEWENFAHRGDAHYYWLTGEFENNDAENEKNDHWALDNGYVAITPTTVDATAYGLIDELKAWF